MGLVVTSCVVQARVAYAWLNVRRLNFASP